MKLCRRLARSRSQPVALAALLSCSISLAQSQDVLVSPAAVDQPALTAEEAAETRIGSVSTPARRRAPGETTPLQWGPLRFLPRLSYQLVYGDGILRDTNGPQKTAVHTITPGLQIEMGRFWDLDLGVGITRYSNAEFNNSIGYSFGLSGNIPLDQWALSLGYSTSLSDSPQVETGTQSEQMSHSLSAGAVYTYSDRFSVDTGVSASTRQTDQFADYWEWSTAEWLNYHWTPRTTLGVGVNAGYNLVNPGADSVYGRPQVRVIWLPGPRLSFQVSVGVQFQLFLRDQSKFQLPVVQPDGDIESPSTDDELGIFPTYQAAITYKVSDPLSLSLHAGHEVGNSVLTDLFTETSSVGVGASQRLFKRLHLNVGTSYQSQKYRSTGRNFSVGREDEFLSFNVGLSTVLFSKLSTSVFYQYSDNTSTAEGFAFDSNQVGLQLSYRF